MNSRLKELRSKLGFTQTEFANKIDKSLRGVQNYEADLRTPDATTVKKICQTFNVNPDWLLTGKGSMFTIDNDNARHVSFQSGTITVRYYPEVRAAAGYGAFNENEEYVDYQIVNDIDVDALTDVIIKITGDSMTPTLCENDKVLLSTKQCTELILDKIYAVIVGGTLIVKRYAGVIEGSYIFSSDNNTYKNVFLKMGDESNKIVGRVKAIIYRKIDE